jgi:hypothetical protein
VVISSDEESDTLDELDSYDELDSHDEFDFGEESIAHDTNHEADRADYPPFGPEIMAKQGAERGRADSAGEQAQPAWAYLDGR